MEFANGGGILMADNRMTVGIDPGTKTGIGIAISGRLVDLKTTDFWGAYDFVTNYQPEQIELIVIEVSSKTHVWHKNKTKGVAMAAKIGQSVGAVRNEGKLLAERFEALGFLVKTMDPLGKMNARMFKQMTGYMKQTNEHTRDAGRLALLRRN